MLVPVRETVVRGIVGRIEGTGDLGRAVGVWVPLGFPESDVEARAEGGPALGRAVNELRLVAEPSAGGEIQPPGSTHKCSRELVLVFRLPEGLHSIVAKMEPPLWLAQVLLARRRKEGGQKLVKGHVYRHDYDVF